MFSLICTRINVWVNNREAGDLRRPSRRHCNANYRSSQEGGATFNPIFKGFTLYDFRTLKCYGFRPSRANWWEMLNFLEAYDRKECRWIECQNYSTFRGCYCKDCPYAHPPPVEIRYENSLQFLWLARSRNSINCAVILSKVYIVQITPTPYEALPLFATRFTACARWAF